MSNPTALVQKLWNYCDILRDDGLSYGDYVEQLTFLLFLKVADAQSRPPFNKPSPIPKGKDWPALLAKDGDELEIHYRHTLEELGKRSGCSASFSAKREGERAVLRPQTRAGKAVDGEALDIRPAHEQAFHAQGEYAEASGSVA
jgi:hypothetical protein